MKKIIVFLCMLTCIFGLTACGEEPVYTEFEQAKLDYAEQNAAYLISEMIDPFTDGGVLSGKFDDYSAHEMEGIINGNFPIIVDGYTFLSAVSSFNSGKETIGEIVEQGEITSKFDGDTIVVNVEIVGSERNATAEVIFAKDYVITDDLYFELQSASLNPKMSFGELMGKAALNTLVGMGTVFAVLLFISFIISLFKYIPKLQESFKKKEKSAGEGVQNGVNQIESNEAQKVETVDESDDIELVAVIAAAIASYEGQTSTDGFVVRSIRRRFS